MPHENEATNCLHPAAIIDNRGACAIMGSMKSVPSPDPGKGILTRMLAAMETINDRLGEVEKRQAAQEEVILELATRAPTPTPTPTLALSKVSNEEIAEGVAEAVAPPLLAITKSISDLRKDMEKQHSEKVGSFSTNFSTLRFSIEGVAKHTAEHGTLLASIGKQVGGLLGVMNSIPAALTKASGILDTSEKHVRGFQKSMEKTEGRAVQVADKLDKLIDPLNRAAEAFARLCADMRDLLDDRGSKRQFVSTVASRPTALGTFGADLAVSAVDSDKDKSPK